MVNVRDIKASKIKEFGFKSKKEMITILKNHNINGRNYKTSFDLIDAAVYHKIKQLDDDQKNLILLFEEHNKKDDEEFKQINNPFENEIFRDDFIVTNQIKNLIKNGIQGEVKIDIYKIENHDNRLRLVIDLLKSIKIKRGVSYLIDIDGMFFTLTRNNLQKTIDDIEKAKFVHTSIEISDSIGLVLDVLYADPQKLIIKEIEMKYSNRKPRDSGNFFNYKHRINNNYAIKKLEEYGIFYIDKKIGNQNACIIEALRHSLPIEQVNQLIATIKTENYIKCKLNKICDLLNINIKVRTLKACKNEIKTLLIQSEIHSDRTIEICLLDEHYFKYDADCGISKYFINNYPECNDPLQTRDNGRRNEPNLNSFNLVKLLLQNKERLLEDIDVEEINYRKIKPIDSIDQINIENESQLIDVKEKPIKEFYEIIYFDCETFTSEDTQIHNVYKVCCAINSEDEIYEFNTMEEFINFLVWEFGDKQGKRKLLLYAHNSTYDSSFLLKHMDYLDITEKDNKFVKLVGGCRYSRNNQQKKLIIEVRDSLRLMPMALSTFPKSFDIRACVKEVMYYNMYNSITYPTLKAVPYIIVKHYIKEFEKHSMKSSEELNEMKNMFWENVKNWHCENENETINLDLYSTIYCKQDVNLLKKGMQKFAEILKNIDQYEENEDERIEINLYDYYSLPSMVFDYFKKKGCYDGCMKLQEL